MQLNRKYIIASLVITSLVFGACTKKKPEELPSTDPTDGGGTAVVAKVFAKYANDTNAATQIVATGVSSGQSVQLFSDTTCSSALASATASGSSVTFDVSGLALGAHRFSAKVNGGACSTVNATYTRVSPCPTGYVKVEGDTFTGVKPFCVMQFEAKNVSGVPTSQASGMPWSAISADDAKAKCKTLGSDYDMISSLEWQTIVRDVEQQDSNWVRTQGLDPVLPKGRSNGEGGTTVAIAVADPSNPWSGITVSGAPSTNFEYRRTLNLSNGSTVWDMAGNAVEFVDYGMASTYTSPPTCTGGSSAQSAYVIRGQGNCPNTPYQHYMTADPAGMYTWGYGIVETGPWEKTILRGGGNPGGASTSRVGIGAWAMVNIDPADSTTSSATVAFRCVKRLNPVPVHSRSVAMSLTAATSVSVANAQPGDTYTFSTDGICSNNIGSVTANSSTATATVTMPSAGVHKIYFKVTSPDGGVGPCLPQSVSYEWRACPTGFVMIPANASRGVAAFCAMKYEARKNGTSASVDLNDGYWDSSWSAGSKAACEQMNNYPDTNISMMTNDEWMTIADNVYNVAYNWSSGTVGTGFLATGVTNQVAAAATTNPSDPWSGVLVSGAPTTSFKYRRTLRLSTGEDMWDLAGNLEEQVEYGTPSGTTTPNGGPTCNGPDSGVYQELQTAAGTCPLIPSVQILPPDPTLGSAAGMGKFFAYQNGGDMSRGGSYNRGASAGLYTYRARAGNDSNEGVRCVYRP